MKNPNALIASDYGPIIINTHDAIIGRSISQLGYWAADDIGLIRTLLDVQLKKADHLTFYDVGANIGTHTLAIAKTYGSKVKVRAFEAQRQIFNMLCGTVALNGLSNVHCHHHAVSGVSGEVLEIALPDYNSANNFGGLELLAPQRSDNGHMVKTSMDRVTTLSIDSFDERVDFIKMDIEGMEDKALSGATVTVDRHRPICFVEIFKTDVPYVVEFFRSRGYLGFKKAHDLIVILVEYQIQVVAAERVF